MSGCPASKVCTGCILLYIDAGKLPEEHKAALLAGFARKRLAAVLDLLRRMRLVTAAIGGPTSVQGQRRVELLDSALYAVEPIAWAQEQGSLVSSFNKPLMRSWPASCTSLKSLYCED